MGLHDQYGLTRVINARGPFTPLGVSRSTDGVASVTAEALSGFFVMEELKDLADRTIAEATGAEAGTVVHCTSAGITLSVAASMTGASQSRVAALPDTRGMPKTVLLPAGHAVDYGHPIVQDVRLTGATPVLVGSDAGFTLDELEEGFARPDVACLLLVSSRLTRGDDVPLAEAVALAHRHGVPAIIDGAAQDFRVKELLGTGADLVTVSGQKYLGSPTAGLVIGRGDLVRAVRAQEKGIGRAMKPSKEAIFGVVAALRARHETHQQAWEKEQHHKVARFVERASGLRGISAAVVPDPTGLPFPRARLSVDPAAAGLNAATLAKALQSGTPSIWVMAHDQDKGELTLELVPLTYQELDVVLGRLAELSQT
ncbi:threonine aldolase [Streptomyces antioxidans]|uniref:Threonine aldolase n=1 Tax=Streptomyces antioxidans TaxID=1507734 RepID=A0A1V4CXT4_9ACTN|nr:beta-eliminating lyase-related protein [Streptomyces antioxidans]OPF73165.1 threonine aldolase [Streptomyces antioxidans]